MVKNVGSVRSKEVNEKIRPCVACSVRSKDPMFMQNLKYVGTTVVEFCFSNQIMKICENYFCVYYTHTTSNF